MLLKFDSCSVGLISSQRKVGGVVAKAEVEEEEESKECEIF